MLLNAAFNTFTKPLVEASPGFTKVPLHSLRNAGRCTCIYVCDADFKKSTPEGSISNIIFRPYQQHCIAVC